jgi:uncharacterized protein YbjT (DUF2867 family)
MYTIAGVTGRVGAATSARLLVEGRPVRALVRDTAKGEPWAQRGADVAVADLGDRARLAEALDGATGFFTLLPFDLGTPDFNADTRRLATSIAGAVADSGVPHVVVLSSAGADLPEGTGPIRGLHLLEEELRATGTTVTAVRSGHFQEKVTDLLDAARHEGIYPSFGASADVPKSMIATRDIGGVVAGALVSPPEANEVIDVEGPLYTERQVAERLGAALGRPLQVVDVPQAAWIDTLVAAGFPTQIAALLAELYDADERGLLQPRGDRRVQCSTEIDETLHDLVGSAAA